MLLSFQASFPIRVAQAFSRGKPSLGGDREPVSRPLLVAAMRVDAHVHVWDPKFSPHPDHPLPVSLPGTATDLIERMDAAGVDKTVIVQPINYKFDHSCLEDAVRSHPTRFAAVALADSTLPAAEACTEMERLAKECGFRGVRLNPTFTKTGFADDTVAALVRKAGELDIPVALFARPQHLDDVAVLLERFPGTEILLDHFAFCTPGEEDQARRKVIEMGRRFKQLYVKTSAWFRVSQEPWPHRDLHAYLADLIDAFGPKRMLVGSDYPYVKEQYDYSKAFLLLDEAPVSTEARDWIGGRTATQLYKL